MDVDFIHDLFAEFGRVEVKRMFSGQGIYAGGAIFAIVSGDVIYLKTDEATRPAFEREHATALTFTKKTGQRMVTSYWRLPERLYDAPDELAQWARQALAVARAKKTVAEQAKKPARKAVKKSAKKLAKKAAKKPARKSAKKRVKKKAGRKTRL